MFSLIKSPFLPPDFNVLVILMTFFMVQAAVIKCDIMLSEINCNLSPLKFDYFVAKDIKSKHELTKQNYNRLAFLIRFCFIGLVYYGLPIISIFTFSIVLMLFIKTKRFYFLVHEIVIEPFYVNGYIVISQGSLIIASIIYYYKMRFDQLYRQIKSITPNGKVISKRKEKLLLGLFHEHNKLAVEIHKINLLFRRSVAGAFINLSFMKIITLHLIFNTKDY